MTDEAVSQSEGIAAAMGLPQHPDRPKRWDNALAVLHAATLCDFDAPVLDAGAELYSAFLPSLSKLGYERLTGINTAFRGAGTKEGIRYRHGDVTQSPFEDGSFRFVACLSVIEHGVDVARFLREQARLLAPGGHLFVSFDYWEAPVDTGGQRAFGQPIKIFDADDVAGMIDVAGGFGLELDRVFRPECDARVVHWKQFDLRYTFANLLWRRA